MHVSVYILKQKQKHFLLLRQIFIPTFLRPRPMCSIVLKKCISSICMGEISCDFLLNWNLTKYVSFFRFYSFSTFPITLFHIVLLVRPGQFLCKCSASSLLFSLFTRPYLRRSKLMRIGEGVRCNQCKVVQNM